MGPQSVLRQGEIFTYLQTISARRWLPGMCIFVKKYNFNNNSVVPAKLLSALCYALECQRKKTGQRKCKTERESQEFLPLMSLVFDMHPGNIYRSSL